MNKPTAHKKSLDLFSLFYGIGAAILISGILFKHLGWKYADTMFVVGLTFEVIIFLFSSINFKQEEREGYRWDRVFPQLSSIDSADDESEQNEDQVLEAMNLLRENLVAQRRLYGDISASLSDVRNSLDNLSKEIDRVVPDVSSSLNDVKGELDKSKSTAKNLQSKLQQVNTLLEE